MSYTPSAVAQAIATLAGNNLAALTPALTAMQTSITGGNLGPAAMMDAIVSGGMGLQAVQIQGVNTSAASSSTYVDIAGSSWTFTPTVTKAYIIIALIDVYFSPVGSGGVRINAAGTAGNSRLADGSVTANQFIPIAVFDKFTLTSGGARTIKLQFNAPSGTINTTSGSSSAFFAVIG